MNENVHITPKLGNVVGHEGPKRELEQALSNNQLHHGWLFQGPRGIGKSRLALLFSCALLNNQSTLTPSKGSQVSHMMESGSHPDFLYVSRPTDEKGKLKSDIPVDSIRKLSRFFSLRPALGGWRVAVIDSIDDLNASSANALLKTLEEPPEKSVLILISQGEKPTLPTLRSRCRKVRLSHLNEQATLVVLTEIGVTGSDAKGGMEIAPGRPGQIMKLQDKSTKQAIDAIKRAIRVQADAKAVKEAMSAASRSEEAFTAAYSVLRNETQNSALKESDPIRAGEWANLVTTLQKLENETLGLNMDKSQAISSGLLQYKRHHSASSV